MKLYRDVDYYLCFEEFPRMGVPGAIAANGDGTCTIYINTLYCRRRQRETLRHELRHLALQHLWREDLSLRAREAAAGELEGGDVKMAPDFSWVEAAPDRERG